MLDFNGLFIREGSDIGLVGQISSSNIHLLVGVIRLLKQLVHTGLRSTGELCKCVRKIGVRTRRHPIRAPWLQYTTFVRGRVPTDGCRKKRGSPKGAAGARGPPPYLTSSHPPSASTPTPAAKATDQRSPSKLSQARFNVTSMLLDCLYRFWPLPPYRHSSLSWRSLEAATLSRLQHCASASFWPLSRGCLDCHLPIRHMREHLLHQACGVSDSAATFTGNLLIGWAALPPTARNRSTHPTSMAV